MYLICLNIIILSVHSRFSLLMY